jgi:hypothetical protein
VKQRARAQHRRAPRAPALQPEDEDTDAAGNPDAAGRADAAGSTDAAGAEPDRGRDHERDGAVP